MIHDGLASEGETEIMQLTRSAWAGMQVGALVALHCDMCDV